MKKILLILTLLAATALCYGQPNDNRSATTRVSDALAQLPAKDAAALDFAMQDLVTAGPEGMALLTGMFTDFNNVPVNYALNGLSFYVTENGRQQARQVFEDGIIAALPGAEDLRVRKFYIDALARTGSDKSIPVLAGLLNDAELAAYAASALAAMNTPAARDAVKAAVIDDSADRLLLSHTVWSMGHIDVYPQLSLWLTGEDDLLNFTVREAMASTGDRRAVEYLAARAKKAGYGANEQTGQYLTSLMAYRTADPTDAAKRSAEVLAKSMKARAYNTAASAYAVYLVSGGRDVAKYLLPAMDSGDRSFRSAMLATSAIYADDALYEQLLKKAAKSKDPAVKEDIFYFIGQNNEQYAARLAPWVTDPNEDVAVAAIEAYAFGGNNPVVELLLPVIAGGSSARVVDAAAGAIVRRASDEVRAATAGGMLDGVYAAAGTEGRTAVLEIIGAKQLTGYTELVIEATGCGEQEISLAAYRALSGVATPELLPQLFGILTGADPHTAPYVQQAVIAAMYDMAPARRLETIRAEMNKAGAAKPAFYTLLAASGDDRALAILETEYAGATAAGKAEVVKALALRGDLDAAGYLYGIAKNDSNTAALDAYITAVAASELNDERKLIKLAAAAAVTDDAALKARIVTESGKLYTFQSLLFTGGFLEDGDAAVRDLAAQGVMDIAMAREDLYGDVVTELLEKASGALTNPDAQYHRQAIAKHLSELPEGDGFVAIFNGRDLTGWKGLVENPIARAAMSPKELERRQAEADEIMRRNWTVRDGCLLYVGDGYDNICTVKDYGDIEMYMDWRLYPEDEDGDGGIYLRGVPQIQIWDTSRTHVGAEVGSGGLYNNIIEGNNPLVYADNPIGEWNTFRIIQKGDRVTVWLNGDLVVDNVVLENFWDRTQPIFRTGQIEIQGHTTRIDHKNIYVKELPMAQPYKVSDEERADGFTELFDGVTLEGWYGNTRDYVAEDGNIVLYPTEAIGGNLYTEEEYGDFILRFEFLLTPGANNGIGIRTPDEGDAAYVGMEIQVLDDTAPIYANLAQYQYHGSVYGIIPAKRGHLKSLGEWNVEEIYAKGNHIRVTLNGVVIVDGDLAEATRNGTLDGLDHPGLFNRSGHIAFLGHGSMVKFRNLRIKRLD